MKIVMAASECVPFVKVGGLADVVGSLPKALKAKRHDVRIVIPKYRKIDDAKFGLRTLPCRLLIPVGDRYEDVTVKEGTIGQGIPVYFIENDNYFNRPEVYRTQDGDYPDNRERFIFFSRAVLETCKALNFQPDIIHCHDWQTGIIPAYLKTIYNFDGFYCNTATVYTIHNIAYQGMFDADTVALAGFPWAEFTWNKLEYYGKFNFMKAGLIYADVISTVSPSYAQEIQREGEGRGMEGILRSRTNDVSGILNGIDYSEWNPVSDPHIAAHFSMEDSKGKAACKADLQQQCKLPLCPDTLLLGAVSRLDPQKGYDLLGKVLPRILSKNVQVVILGSGDRDLQDIIRSLAGKYPARMSVHFEFNDPLAHKIYAGADAFLMPSRFEPCGLGQMIALAYGAIPIVNKTGGLADTIVNFEEKKGTGNGFVFFPAQPAELRFAIERACKTYRDKKRWSTIMTNAFKSDFSWKIAVNKYARLYKKASEKRSAKGTAYHPPIP
jgi:starch synthase